MTNVNNKFQLDHCVDWIVYHDFYRVVLQLNLDDLKHSTDIVHYIESNVQLKRLQTHSESVPKPVELYVTQSSTCCVDLLVTQHLSQLDALIHLGEVCLSKPDIRNRTNTLPVLFAFGRPIESEQDAAKQVQSISSDIQSELSNNPSSKVCILFDASLVGLANMLAELFNNSSNVHVAKLFSPEPNWFTTPPDEMRFCRVDMDDMHRFDQYVIPEHIDNYTLTVHLGQRPSVYLTLEASSKQIRYNCYNSSIQPEHINVSKLLNKRVAVLNRIKDDEELRIGVIITNPLPNVSAATKRLESYAKLRKHTLYFITMIQTIDECKIGNFDLCDAFVIINSCTCSKIMESLVFNRPIINEIEFKLACGIGAVYGRVEWPGTSERSNKDDVDVISKRKASDVSLALVQMRNELLERCSQARANKWSGLEYKTVDAGESGHSLEIQQGLTGIASTYESEPLKAKSSGLLSTQHKVACVGLDHNQRACVSEFGSNKPTTMSDDKQIK